MNEVHVTNRCYKFREKEEKRDFDVVLIVTQTLRERENA